VLTLGWEFPPHISGGLGTACHGLTMGLAHHGVQILMVVPRAHGDEDARFVQVLGANQVPVAVRSARRARPRRGSARHGSRGDSPADAESDTGELGGGAPDAGASDLDAGGAAELGESDPAARALELLAVDSPLRPYLTAHGYGRALLELGSDDESARAGEAPSAEEVRGGLAALLARHAPRALELAAGAGHGRRGEPRSDTGAWRALEFSGRYGADLFAEVARYALVVGEIARRERFDLVHAHDWMTFPAALVAKAVSGRPLVIHVHACEYDRSGEAIDGRIRDLEQAGLDGADRIACVSHYTAGMLRRHYRVDRAKLRVVHNAVTHREQLEAWHHAKSIPEPIVLFLGRITFQKGPDYFLEAARRVVEIQPRVKFVMSGSGDMLPSMIERAARLGLARHVHFTGFLRNKDVERMYAMADIYVMPSVSEPFGISPLEAMALDVPVVVSRQSGVAEVLKNALKFDFWDVDDLANKILALLSYPALARHLSEEGQSEVRRLRWEHQGRVLLDVYRELVA
jgi:glycosyltransferase involved in cell wall biosynthesis